MNMSVILEVKCMESLTVERFEGAFVEDALSKVRAYYKMTRATASGLWLLLHVFPCDHDYWRLFRAKTGKRWGIFLIQHINDEE